MHLRASVFALLAAAHGCSGAHSADLQIAVGDSGTSAGKCHRCFSQLSTTRCQARLQSAFEKFEVLSSTANALKGDGW
jgi:hypothetical protein